MNATKHLVRRPFGITITALVLGWLSFAGFGNALILPAIIGTQGDLHVFREPLLAAILLSAGALFYGVTALFACRALWRMQERGLYAFSRWIVAVIVLFILIITFMRMPRDTPVIFTIIFGVLFSLALWVWRQYVRRAYQRESVR